MTDVGKTIKIRDDQDLLLKKHHQNLTALIKDLLDNHAKEEGWV